MLAEQQANRSTGGIALPYYPCMRNAILPLSLSILLLACGDDGEPTRPADGTVKAWDSCVWDGQQVPELCEASLACSAHGVCSPVCESIDDCPNFDGFNIECSDNAEAKICRPLCDSEKQCPDTGGVPLQCINGYCIGNS